MNAVGERVPSWTRQRWLWAVVLTFSVQVGLFWLLSDSAPLRVRRPRSGPALLLLAGTPADVQFHRSVVLGDPTGYALATRRGFSGTVWWDVPRPRLELGDWREPESWLTPKLATFATTFLGFVQSNAVPSLALVEKPPAAVTEIPTSGKLLPAQSTLRIEGPLARRGLQTAAKLPVWPAVEWVTNTVVQLAVNAAGQPVSVVLLERSGSPEADQLALGLARSARFQPLPGEPLPAPLAVSPRTWGTLVFRWQVQLPSPSARVANPP